MTWDLRLGRWQDVLADVECDALICDPPYSVRVHQGFRSHDDMVAAQRAQLMRNKSKGVTNCDGKRVTGRAAYGSVGYAPIGAEEIAAFVESWARRVAHWVVLFGDHISWALWSDAWNAAGWYVFAPVAWHRTGGTPRFQGDGPCNALEWICVARPRRKTVCGSLPGVYTFDVLKGNSPEKIVTGGKPLDLMRALVRDYSRPGDLVCDPTSGGATTLLAAAMEGRRAVGAEMDPQTHAKAMARLQRGYTPQLPGMERSKPEQVPLLDEAGE